MRKDDVLTRQDLDNFKNELLEEIKIIIQNEKPKVWMKAKKILEHYPFSAGKLHALRVSGKLACTRLDGNFYYCRDDIEKMLENNKLKNS